MSHNDQDKPAYHGLPTDTAITNSEPPKPRNAGFNFSNMDWVAYTAFRPAYPDALYGKMYAHHELHGGTFSSALDVGAGIGIVTARLLETFEHVTLSDASELYISQARQVFSHHPQSRLSFVHSTAEQLELDLLRNGRPVDLIVAGMCLHWTDLDVCVPRFASMLQPNGTFAAWVYGSRPVLPQDLDLVQVRHLVNVIIDRFGRAYEEQIEKQRENSAAAILNARLDSIDFDPSVWTDVHRVHANKAATMTCDWWPAAASRVRPDEGIEELEDDAFLSREVDFNWLKGYLSNLIPVIDVPELVQVELSKLEAAMAGRTVQLKWSLAMVLATKR